MQGERGPNLAPGKEGAKACIYLLIDDGTSPLPSSATTTTTQHLLFLPSPSIHHSILLLLLFFLDRAHLHTPLLINPTRINSIQNFISERRAELFSQWRLIPTTRRLARITRKLSRCLISAAMDAWRWVLWGIYCGLVGRTRRWLRFGIWRRVLVLTVRIPSPSPSFPLPSSLWLNPRSNLSR
jgi:hypothetical protein